MKRLLILLLLSSPVFAARIYQHDDPKMNDELDKIYHDQLYLRAVNVQASTGVFTYIQVDSMTVRGQMNSTLPMGSHKITGLSNGTASTDAAAFGQLKIIQSTFTLSTTATSTTSSAFTATNCTAAITPTSASNAILVIATSQMTNSNQGVSNVFATLDRGGTNLGDATRGFGEFLGNTANTGRSIVTMTIMDTPASTSKQTYTVKIRSTGGTAVVWGENSITQSMILMEVVLP